MVRSVVEAASVLGCAALVLLLSFLLAVPARADSFTFGSASIASWRGRGDSVPHQPQVQWNGWAGPLFYRTPEEGAYQGGPSGKRPTGRWAPGDVADRMLHVKNTSKESVLRLHAVDAVLYGDVRLARWFRISIRSPRNDVLYEGTLADLADSIQPLNGPRGFLRMPGHSEQQLTFVVTLDPLVPNGLQGSTLKADFRIYADPE